MPIWISGVIARALKGCSGCLPTNGQSETEYGIMLNKNYVGNYSTKLASRQANLYPFALRGLVREFINVVSVVSKREYAISFE